ncbi:efflux RND transporter periplasmic adaptor subunit [Methylococcus sp. EFPC2]|uniref:efflux RND transporter periplasmic adaptor subunit n=1 Tax=Methylococcus sp. EFPC2 TaxID=2812648 RepID=UPI00196819C6|nr:efflux RND transporter periplasmic adaptor subunit [Methylococcus sp. EFPC2]QSA96437.1 efflux RND transporter periplasmic adaptor subunit [Methylococcus sp. EFPC2]
MINAFSLTLPSPRGRGFKYQDGRAQVSVALVLSVLALTATAVLTVAHGLTSRNAENERLKAWTEAQAIPTVAVVSPAAGGNVSGLELPGRLEAHAQAPIFARVNGYLKRWTSDIGTPVKAGQLLAEIETPDLDQQLAQARADLATAEADAALAVTTAKRWQALLASNTVSRQDVDEKTGFASAKQAALQSARANVERYAALKNFARLVAPFDGVVTTRNTDVGALINAGTGAGQELFVVSDVKRLRVYVSVPQSYVPRVPPGTQASLKVPEHPDRSYTATVSAAAGAVDAASGTSLMQLIVDNAAGQLMPGAYAGVKLDLPRNAASLTIPASALIFDAKGAQVAVLDAGNRVVLKPVSIARDLGKVIEIGAGLAAEDRLIDNPPDGIANGDEVRIAASAPGKPKAG